MMGCGVRMGVFVFIGGICMCVSFCFNLVGKIVSKGSGWYCLFFGYGSLGGIVFCVWDYCEEVLYFGLVVFGSICCVYCGFIVFFKRLFFVEILFLVF